MTFILWWFHLLIKATYSESFCCKFKKCSLTRFALQDEQSQNCHRAQCNPLYFLRYLVPARESLIIYHEVSSLGRQVVYCNFCDYHNNAGIMHCIMWWIHRLDGLFGGSSVKSVSSRLVFFFFFSSGCKFLFKLTNWLWALLPPLHLQCDCLCHRVYVCSWHYLSFWWFADYLTSVWADLPETVWKAWPWPMKIRVMCFLNALRCFAALAGARTRWPPDLQNGRRSEMKIVGRHMPH